MLPFRARRFAGIVTAKAEPEPGRHRHSMRNFLATGAAMLVLALGPGGCTPTLAPPAPADLTGGLVARTTDIPPPGSGCWSPETLPGVFETVTEQVLAEPEQRAADGTLIRAAAFRTETRQRMVSDRQPVWLAIPCAWDLGPDFVTTLQRALKARGLYLVALTGELDDPTRAAIRAWQRPRGLDTDTLALETARALGLIAVGP